MKYQLLATGAALAPLAAAANVHRCGASLKTEFEVVTVVGSIVDHAPPASTHSTRVTSSSSTDTAETTATAKTQAVQTEAATSAAVQTATAATSAIQSASSSASSSGKDVTISSLSPQGKKAGLSGYVGVQKKQAFSDLSPYISWYSDYTPNTPSSANVTGIGMLWAAAGSGCGDEVTERVDAFEELVATTIPEIMFGFYEPDCSCPDSSAMTTDQGEAAWNSMIAPLKSNGTILGSPSMCKQKDETWLTPFKSNIDQEWDVTSVHINKPNITGVKEDIEYYASTYGKPIWVSEFACVDDHNTWAPCTDQTQINQFINDCVEFFQGNDTVVAFGPSNGNGLGSTWPLINSDGELSESGTTYFNAIKGL